jgi:hypothetical protein
MIPGQGPPEAEAAQQCSKTSPQPFTLALTEQNTTAAAKIHPHY